jgi:3-oxoacyl-[acyl-carrier-protein] synthase-3
MSNPASWLERELGQGGFRDVAQLMNGCDGVMNGIRWAAAHLTCDDEHPAALITAAESWQPMEVIDRWTVDPDVPFGDGGAALVVSREHGIARLLATATYTQPKLEGVHRGPQVFGHGVSLPVNLSERSHAFYATSDISRDEAWKMRGDGISIVLERVLAHAGIERARVARVVLPFNGRYTLEQEFFPYLGKIEPAKSSEDRGCEIGHLGGPDPIAALHFAIKSGELATGDLAIVYSEGVGVVQSAALVEVV